MAALGKKYTAGDVDTTQTDYDDLPAGVYKLEMEASDIIETGEENARTGVGLKYTSNVIEPEELAGRKFFGFINLENKNPQAQEIGQKEFARLRRAVGVDEIDDSEELHFRAYYAKINWGKPNEKRDRDANMEVKKYYFLDEVEAPDTGIDPVQTPKPLCKASIAARSAANSNNRPAANDNKPAAAPAKAAGSKPWAKK